MMTIFQNKRIAGILSVLPEREIYFDDEVDNYNFPKHQTMRLKKIMGYEKHRLVKNETSSSDLCVYGIQKLLNENKINKNDICGIIVVTITPDHFIPHVCNIIQAKCGFSHDTLCIDILQGCCGFIIGFAQACLLLEHQPDKKVLLVNTDTLSKKVSKLDRNSYPLIGDCASITLIENSNDGNKIHYCVYMDGTRRDALKIPAGGSRLACSPETGLMNNDGSGNIRSLDNFFMNGNEVFQFIMSDIPPLIENTLNYANLSHNCIDWYLFHQPNKFILQKLSQKLEINNEKLFMNIVEKYGNTSGSSIPLTITDNLNNLLIDNTYKCCICAFGGGLSYGAMIMDLGNLEFCETHISTY